MPLKNIRCWNCREWMEFEDGEEIKTRNTDCGAIIKHFLCPECDAEICIDMTPCEVNDAESR